MKTVKIFISLFIAIWTYPVLAGVDWKLEITFSSKEKKVYQLYDEDKTFKPFISKTPWTCTVYRNDPDGIYRYRKTLFCYFGNKIPSPSIMVTTSCTSSPGDVDLNGLYLASQSDNFPPVDVTLGCVAK